MADAFWRWLDVKEAAGDLASTDLVCEELIRGNDELSQWAQERNNTLFRVKSYLKEVTDQVKEIKNLMDSMEYEATAQEDFLREKVADPFLVAIARIRKYVVVTEETPEPDRKGKVKIPDICDAFGVEWESPPEMLLHLKAPF